MNLRGLNTGVAWSRRPKTFAAWDGAGVLLAEILQSESKQASNQPTNGKEASSRLLNLCSRGR